MIRLRGVGKTFDGGAHWAVRGVDLEVARGELVALVGESGSGKTTTLRMINRLVRPSEGTVEIDGRDTSALDPVQLRRGIGYVLQSIALFPHISVADNVAVVPRLLGWSADRIRARVDALLDMVGLSPAIYRDRLPDALSGGQQQRVGVARAIAAEPPVVLLDEPFGALDPVTRDDLQRDYRGLHDRLGLTAVLVTHDMAEALTLADRIAVMRDGAVIRVGLPAELLANPGDPYVEALLATPVRNAARIAELRG